VVQHLQVAVQVLQRRQSERAPVLLQRRVAVDYLLDPRVRLLHHVTVSVKQRPLLPDRCLAQHLSLSRFRLGHQPNGLGLRLRLDDRSFCSSLRLDLSFDSVGLRQRLRVRLDTLVLSIRLHLQRLSLCSSRNVLHFSDAVLLGDRNLGLALQVRQLVFRLRCYKRLLGDGLGQLLVLDLERLDADIGDVQPVAVQEIIV